MSPNICLKEGNIEVSDKARILVIQSSDYIPNTLKVAQAIALKIPIVPFAWVTHVMTMRR